MKDALDRFFAAQRKRVKANLESRAGELEDIPESTPNIHDMNVETRGHTSTHSSGRRKPTMDHQGGHEQGLFPHQWQKTPTVWTDYERKAGRMAPFRETK